jgi:hypothetical protein
MATTCVACGDPLLVNLDPSSDDDEEMGGSSSMAPSASTVPDDCAPKSCNCHFHWDCLLSSFQSTSCPSCSTELATTGPHGLPQILCDLNNEGGLQIDHDVLPALKEESYLAAHPDERKARAFLEFCRNGDVPEIVEMLRDDDEDEDDEDEDKQWDIQEVLRYTDTLNNGYSGLHYAVLAQHQDVAWLLLLLASNLDMGHFPGEVMQEAADLGVARLNSAGKQDIRTILDAAGRSPEHLAVEIGGPWARWLGQGLLSA